MIGCDQVRDHESLTCGDAALTGLNVTPRVSRAAERKALG